MGEWSLLSLKTSLVEEHSEIGSSSSAAARSEK